MEKVKLKQQNVIKNILIFLFLLFSLFKKNQFKTFEFIYVVAALKIQPFSIMMIIKQKNNEIY